MITLTMENGRSSIKMEGTDKEVFNDAIATVNALYTAFREDNPALGELFQAYVRLDDSVWKCGKITDSKTISMPCAGAGK